MVVSTITEALPGVSLRSLVKGFVLTKRTEGKSRRTAEYYEENLRRFLWYADRQGWPDDIRFLTEWQIREFLGYVSTEKNRWGLKGNGSETSQRSASHATLHHYWVILSTFFNWLAREGFIADSPVAKIAVAKPKPKAVVPYGSDEISRMLRVCDYDYEHNARFSGSRNRAIILVLLDTGVRLSELVNMKVRDINSETGHIRVLGKGNKERIVRVGKVAQKALWRYLMCRGRDNVEQLWLTEEGRPMYGTGVQSLVKRLKERAGVTMEGSVHRFRHTFAMSFLRAGGGVFHLQYLLGHSDLEMTRRYTSALGMEDALRAHEKASPVDLLGLR